MFECWEDVEKHWEIVKFTCGLIHDCNSMPFDAAWAYYGKVLVLVSVASLNSRMHGKVK